MCEDHLSATTISKFYRLQVPKVIASIRWRTAGGTGTKSDSSNLLNLLGFVSAPNVCTWTHMLYCDGWVLWYLPQRVEHAHVAAACFICSESWTWAIVWLVCPNSDICILGNWPTSFFVNCHDRLLDPEMLFLANYIRLKGPLCALVVSKQEGSLKLVLDRQAHQLHVVELI